jgi:hypothetical protein
MHKLKLRHFFAFRKKQTTLYLPISIKLLLIFLKIKEAVAPQLNNVNILAIYSMFVYERAVRKCFGHELTKSFQTVWKPSEQL